jgi:hypothetical protein
VDSLVNDIRNDGIIIYHLLCNNFSLRFDEAGPIELLMMKGDEPYSSNEKIPADFLFLKRNKNIYLMIMTPKIKGVPINSNLLYDSVTGANQ